MNRWLCIVALSLSVSPAQAADNLFCQGYMDTSGFGYAGTERAWVGPTALIVDLDRQLVTFDFAHLPITNVKEVSAGGTLIDFGGNWGTIKYVGSLDRITGGLSVEEDYPPDSYNNGNAGEALDVLQCRRVTPVVGN